MALTPKARRYPPGGHDTTAVDLIVLPDGVAVGKDLDDPTERLEVGAVLGAIISLRRLDTTITNNNTLGLIRFKGDDPAVGTLGAAISSVAKGTWATGDNPAEIRIFTNPGAGAVQVAVFDKDGNLGIDETVPKSDLTLGDDGIFSAVEGSPPGSPAAGYWYLGADSNGRLWFVDGAGLTHTVHFDAFASMRAHPASPATVTISTTQQLTLVDSFDFVQSVDDKGNVTASTSTNLVTIGTNASGEYDSSWHASFKIAAASAGDREIIMLPGATLATPQPVTAVANGPPMVVTVSNHGHPDGDLIEIAGETVTTEVNGSWMTSAATTNDITLLRLDGTNSPAGTGTAAGDGDITIVFSADGLAHKEVSKTTLGVGGGTSETDRAANDKIGIYVANIDDAENIVIAHIALNVKRIGEAA